MHTGRVSKTWVEKHKAVKVRVKGLEVIGFVHCVVVLNKSSDLGVMAEAVFYNTSKRIGWSPLGQGKFGVSVRHAFRTDEDQVYEGAVEKIFKLDPDIARNGRLSTSTEDEDSRWRCPEPETLDAGPSPASFWMEGVTKS